MLNLKTKLNMKNKTSITYKLGISFYTLLVAIIFCGCDVDEQYKHPVKSDGITEYKGYEISTIEYDGHDYIVCIDVRGGWHAVSMIHSASCKLCGSKK